MPPKGYRHLSIREEVFKRLEEFAKSKGVSSLSDAIALLLDYADIYSKLEYLLQTRVYTPSGSKSDLLQTGVATPDKSSSETANITSGTQPNTDPSASQSKNVTKCLNKTEMKYPLESYINIYKSKGILVDWWEEGDSKVCFELKEDSASTESSTKAGTTKQSNSTSKYRKRYYKKQYEDGESWLLQYVPEDWEKE